MSFGQRLKSAIRYKGLTQKEIAESMQVSPQNLNQYIRDKRQPSKDYIVKMAKILGLKYGYTQEGEPFFYVFPVSSELSDDEMWIIEDFNDEQMLDALECSSEEMIHSITHPAGDSKTNIYEKIDKILTLKTQYELLKLNTDGKQTLLGYLRKLLKNPQYQITTPNQDKSIPNELNAAHQRTDIEPTEEDIQNDLDIMNDDSKWE